MTALPKALEQRLRAEGTPERAEGEKRYLKSDLEFLGAKVWQIRSAVKDLTPPMDYDTLVATVVDLWAVPIFERRMAAVFLLERNIDRLGVEDLALMERLVKGAKNLGLVGRAAGGRPRRP